MDLPKTRCESKKDQTEKGQGTNGKYSSKHIRFMETMREKKAQTVFRKEK